MTLKTNADTKEVINDIRNSISRVVLPTDAKAPIVTEIEADTNRTFSVFLYSKKDDISKAFLFDRAHNLKEAIEKVSGINNVVISV